MSERDSFVVFFITEIRHALQMSDELALIEDDGEGSLSARALFACIMKTRENQTASVINLIEFHKYLGRAFVFGR